MGNNDLIRLTKEWLTASDMDFSESEDGILWETKNYIVSVYSHPKHVYDTLIFGVRQHKSGGRWGISYFNKEAIDYFVKKIREKLNETC